ncbi:MAG: hypothetical protein ACLP1E_16535 [Acidimicrobiales bacterium]
MTVRPVCLDAGDAVELSEVLEFIGDWLVSDHEILAMSLGRFVGSGDYEVEEFRADVLRLAGLLGCNEDEQAFAGDER